jgi:hypothetical protein
MKTILVWDAAGRERWLRAGATVPAGWHFQPVPGVDPVCLAEDGRVMAVLVEGSHDQDSHDEEVLVVRAVKREQWKGNQ